MCLVLLAGLSATFGGCGWDGLLLTPRGFEPTEPDRVVLEGVTAPGAQVTITSRDGRVVAAGTAGDSGDFSIALPASEQGLNLQVLARLGGKTFKRIVSDAPAGQFTAIGALDAQSTAEAQLATYEIVSEAGSTFSATPPAALRGLLRRMIEEPTAELAALVSVVAGLLDRVPADGSSPPLFSSGDWRISEAAVAAAGLDAAAIAGYRAALAAAAQAYGLEIRCDPSRLNAMFAVDVSGRARDGNGNPQLIRQATKEGRVYLGFTSDESSPIAGDGIPRKLTPNDPAYAMTDDGQGGDEVAGDGVFTVVVPLPRGARILYKYTNGAAGEGFTGTEEWPGNARIIEIEDVLTGRPDGRPDCLIVRRDSFGDEASNKNFVNINTVAKSGGGSVGFDTDLGGVELPRGEGGIQLGGLSRDDLRRSGPLTPAGVPEARENGTCSPCPPPLILDPDDASAPVLIAAERTAIDRVRVRFSEPLAQEDARDVSRYQYLDDAGQRVPVIAARPSGSEVVLELAPTHPTQSARLQVQRLRDASALGNELASAEVEVGPDRTAPKVVSVRALGILEIEPAAMVADPTIGEVVEIVLDETPESSAASDPSRFVIEGLEVRGAVLVPNAPAPTIRLSTGPQEKGGEYTLVVRGLRDPAGNALEQPVQFRGYALYRVTFSVVPGFAIASSDGLTRGIPRGEKLYLTGTPLGEARALDGTDLSIGPRGGVRTDVTGWPQFELVPTARRFTAANGQVQPVYELELLLPPGSWAWKAAHGDEGEHTNPPPTLEKVYKTLATANDSTGVRVDPATMRAENGLDYTGARLSETGDDPPRRDVVFKREAPDEVCEVTRHDVFCPLIVIGTWRDVALEAGRTIDYDDGLITLPPHRPELPDFSAPKLLDARARDSYSILLSFDEAIDRPASTLEVTVARAEDGVGVRVAVLDSSELRPHQVVIRLDPSSGARLEDGVAYTVRYRGATDRHQPPHTDRTWRTATVLAPERDTPFRPLADRTPPRIVQVRATDLTELVVRFDERLDPASVDADAFTALHAATRAELAVTAAELLPDRESVRLETARQNILEGYTLEARGLADINDPPNVLTSTTVRFVGFGERNPPQLRRVRAIDADRVLVRFDEAVDADSAMNVANYAIDGLTVIAATFAGDPARRGLAFNPRLAPSQRDAVLLTTSPMSAGTTYELSVNGVLDPSGNASAARAPFTGVSEPPRVDVVLEVRVSDGVPVAGQIPARAISLARLSESREGVFVLGARAGADGAPVPGVSGPVNDALRGFPVEGQPLDGLEPRLRDDGTTPDRVAGDGIFSLLLPAVPLGTTILWKAFAPYSTTYRDRNPSDTAAAFADALPGPSVFADGQEFPGHENGAVILDEGESPGTVYLRALFGDEVTYKKLTGGPAYFWVLGEP